MKIIVMPKNEDGCWWYRLMQPYSELQRQGLADVRFAKFSELEDIVFLEEMKKADVVVVRPDHRQFVLTWLKKHFPEKKVVLDIDDDLWTISPYSDVYAWHGTKEVQHKDENGQTSWLWEDGQYNFDIKRNKERLAEDIKLLKAVDLITCSTKRLKKRLSKYNKNIQVVNNGIDTQIWQPYEIKGDKFKIGWTGGSTHYVDWHDVYKTVTKIVNKNDVMLSLAGVSWDGLFKDLEKGKLEFWRWVTPDAHSFRTTLMNLSLAIIPLAEMEFNTYKSCIKWYEFSAIGVPCLVKNFPPYNDEVPREFLYDDEEELEEKLQKLIDSKEMRTEWAYKARKWVLENRKLEDTIKPLNEALCQLLTKQKA